MSPDVQNVFWKHYEIGRQRELARLDLAVANSSSGLRTLIESIPRRAFGMPEPARIVLAERLRDAADAVEHDNGCITIGIANR